MHKVKVRWIDGFEKYYDCSDLQFGKDNYWLKLSNGKEKWIPKECVRHVTTEEFKDATKACGIGQ